MTVRRRDSFRRRLYAWEYEWLATICGDEVVPLDDCTALVHRVWRDYEAHGRKPPVVRSGRGGTARAESWRITLPRITRKRWIVLHEVCHSIILSSPRPELREAAYHGPEFIRLYVDLLARYRGLRAGTVRSSLRTAGLPVARSLTVPRPLSRADRSSLTTVRLRRSPVIPLDKAMQQQQEGAHHAS
jgi:hypothetical protein